MALQGGREQWNTGRPVTCCAIFRRSPLSLRGGTQLSSTMEEEHRPQPNQLGEGEIRTSEPLIPVDINVGVGQNVIEANLGIPTTDVIPTGTPESEAP